MTTYILDTSALLAHLWKETGEARVSALLTTERCLLGAANLAELASKVVERGFPAGEVPNLVNSLNVEIIPMTRIEAELIGALRLPTRHLGLSLGYRACLALAKTMGGTAVTADRVWQGLDIGISIECIRQDSH